MEIQNSQKSVSKNENLTLQVIKIVQKQIGFKIRLPQNYFAAIRFRENQKRIIKKQQTNKQITRKIQNLVLQSNIFNGIINNTVLRANNDKKIKSIDSVESCKYGTSKNLNIKTE